MCDRVEDIFSNLALTGAAVSRPLASKPRQSSPSALEQDWVAIERPLFAWASDVVIYFERMIITSTVLSWTHRPVTLTCDRAPYVHLLCFYLRFALITMALEDFSGTY